MKGSTERWKVFDFNQVALFMKSTEQFGNEIVKKIEEWHGDLPLVKQRKKKDDKKGQNV